MSKEVETNMGYREYLVQLDNDNYGWSFLWNNTITGLKGLCTRLEIISCVSPIVLVYTDKCGRQIMNYIKGIKTIEGNELYTVDV